jgi:hypothetical protein
MGGVPRSILSVVALGLLLAAGVGFALGFSQSDRKVASSEAVPIAANLPANVVIKDAQPLAPPPPPPPKPKAVQAEADSDEAASDSAPAEPPQTANTTDEAPRPIPAPAAPSLPGQPLPNDLPPT